MSVQTDEKTKIVYRHHPADIVAIAVAVAVIVLLVASRFETLLSALSEQSSIAAGLGAAAFVVLFSVLFIWGTMSEHRLDAETEMALRRADDNLRRIDTLDERLAHKSEREPGRETVHQ